MLKRRNPFFLFLLILILLLLSSCFLQPHSTEGLLKGQVLVPEGTLKHKDLTGVALPDATVNIIDMSTGEIIATTTTDTSGHYQVFVPAGGPYLLEAIKDGMKLQQITCVVETGMEHDLGTADCISTAAALIAQAMLDEGDSPSDIDCTAIIADAHFNDVSSMVCSIIKDGGDPSISTLVWQAIGDFLHPSELIPVLHPTPAYTVTLQVNPGSAGTITGDGSYQPGSTIEITATAESCYNFINWTDDDDSDAELSTNVVYTFTMPSGNVHYTANFSSRVYNADTGVDYTSIQAAIDAASNDQTIIVCPGTYYENIELNNKDITLKSSFPSDSFVVANTVIDGGENGVVVTFLNGDSSTLNGLTIQNGNAVKGGGILILNSSPTISNNNIQNNTAGYGGGIALDHSSSLIKNNMVSYNTGTEFGGGFYIQYSSPSLTNNLIQNNTAGQDGGGIHLYDESDPIIKGNTICSNEATHNGGGISVNNYSDPNISANNITGNTANSDGGGIYVTSFSAPAITGNTIASNMAKYGCGISVWNNHSSSPFIIRGNIIDSNINAFMGGGIYIQDSSNLTVSELNDITHNSAITGGGISIWNSSLTIEFNWIDDNTATLHGGGIDLGGENSIIIEQNVISGNIASGDAYGSYGGGIYLDNLFLSVTIIGNGIVYNVANVVLGQGGGGGGIYVKPGAVNTPTIGGDGGWNMICGNIPDQTDPNLFYSNNYIYDGEICPQLDILEY